MTRKVKRYYLLAATLFLGALLWIYVPATQRRQHSAICRIEAATCYALPLGKADTLFLSLRGDSLADASVVPGEIADTVDLTGVFVSRAGDVVTTDSLVKHGPEVLSLSEARRRVKSLRERLSHRQRLQHSELGELDYYAKTHSVVDDGYNEVMAYREQARMKSRHVDAALALLQRADSLGQLRATLYVRGWIKGQEETDGRPAIRMARARGLMLWRRKDESLPVGASYLPVYRLGTYSVASKLLAYNDFGGKTAKDVPTKLVEKSELLPATEGGAWINPSGQICGIQRHGIRVSSWQLAGLLRQVHPWPVWWGLNFVKWISAWSNNGVGKHKTAVGGGRGVSSLSGDTCVLISLPDSARYEGRAKRVAKDSLQRCGYGRLTYKDGTYYEGMWSGDSLRAGRLYNAEGMYAGQFNHKGEPDGEGVLHASDGSYYSGEWADGRRDGHGFSIRAGHIVQCGDWKKGRFRGERMVYTSDRVYGIDISRYQHGRGRRYYPIDWGKLRITSLGNGRRVQGRVDYPVSYLYIKATEGRSLYNKYYAADLRQARRHGIPVGSYHFFSATSSGAQQAVYFLKMAWIASGDLPPVLDLEPTEAQVRQMGGEREMFRRVQTWLNIVERRCGKRPILYVGQQFVNRHLVNAPRLLRDYDVWIARYGEFKPYVHLLHWQLTPYGRVRGIRGEVDVNVFNGTRAQFREYLKRN